MTEPDPHAGRLKIGIVVSAVTAIAWIASFAVGVIEIGVPGEWLWGRHMLLTIPDVAIPITVCVAVIAVYLVLVRTLARKLDGSGWQAWVAVPTVGVIGFVVLWSMQSCAPSPHRNLKPMWVLYHWGSSGYFVDARELDGLAGYLDGFEAEMREGDVLHKGTHPPGLVMLNYGLLKLCRENEGFASAVRDTMPDSVSMEFEREVSKLELSSPDRAALWLSVLLTQLAAAMTVVPLYGLLRRELSRESSLLLASLWPLVPGVAVFLPKSDAIYPCIAATLLWFTLSAWDKGSIVRAACAGVVFWLGMMLSLAMLPVAVLAGLHALIRIRQQRPTVGSAVGVFAGLLGAFAVATALFYFATGVRLWNTWLLNFHNHAGFYAHFERTYSKWLVVNPLELVLTVGAPVLLMSLVGVVAAIRTRNVQRFATPLAVVGTWSLLWLSGKNMGEAARLWVLLTPAFVWGGAAILASNDKRTASRVWWALGTCQAVVAIATVAIVNGFSGHQ